MNHRIDQSRKDVHSRRDFVKSVSAAMAGVLTGPPSGLALADGDSALFPRLDTVGNRFTFALLADPQVPVAGAGTRVGRTTQRRLTQVIHEINVMAPVPPFVVFDGDLVGTVVPGQMENFVTRTKELKALPILVHGNHDGPARYGNVRYVFCGHVHNGIQASLKTAWTYKGIHFITSPTSTAHDFRSTSAFFEPNSA